VILVVTNATGPTAATTCTRRQCMFHFEALFLRGVTALTHAIFTCADCDG